MNQEVTAFRRRFRGAWNISCNIGSTGANTAIQLGKTAMNADTSDAVLTLVININVINISGDDALRTTAATLAGS